MDGWDQDQALQSADCALAAFREAEVQRKEGDLDSADATTDQALLVLQERYKFYSHLLNTVTKVIYHTSLLIDCVILLLVSRCTTPGT